jgi:hypothetical protein
MSLDRRGDRTQEVIGSIPFSSTKSNDRHPCGRHALVDRFLRRSPSPILLYDDEIVNLSPP